MSYLILCLVVFVSAYLLNVFYVTVLYHRGLAHGAVALKPWTRKLVALTGNWVTGLDPKGWVCMHRMHHQHSDTELDPHSPANLGVLGVFLGQHKSYEATLRGLKHNKQPYASLVRDLDFPVNALNLKRLWALPYFVHLGISLVLAFGFGAWLLGAAYWFGMMSHPIQGWLVNSFGHRFGYTNFDNGDDSKNNTLVAWLVVGEGYQNNHHANPSSPKFSFRWYEFDGGYVLCRIARKLGLIEIKAA